MTSLADLRVSPIVLCCATLGHYNDPLLQFAYVQNFLLPGVSLFDGYEEIHRSFFLSSPRFVCGRYADWKQQSTCVPSNIMKIIQELVPMERLYSSGSNEKFQTVSGADIETWKTKRLAWLPQTAVPLTYVAVPPQAVIAYSFDPPDRINLPDEKTLKLFAILEERVHFHQYHTAVHTKIRKDLEGMGDGWDNFYTVYAEWDAARALLAQKEVRMNQHELELYKGNMEHYAKAWNEYIEPTLGIHLAPST